MCVHKPPYTAIEHNIQLAFTWYYKTRPQAQNFNFPGGEASSIITRNTRYMP